MENLSKICMILEIHVKIRRGLIQLPYFQFIEEAAGGFKLRKLLVVNSCFFFLWCLKNSGQRNYLPPSYKSYLPVFPLFCDRKE